MPLACHLHFMTVTEKRFVGRTVHYHSYDLPHTVILDETGVLHHTKCCYHMAYEKGSNALSVTSLG